MCMVKAAVVIDMSQEIRRGIYNILMDNSRKKSDCVTAMSFSIAIRRIQFQLLMLSWSIWLNTVLYIQPREGFNRFTSCGSDSGSKC